MKDTLLAFIDVKKRYYNGSAGREMYPADKLIDHQNNNSFTSNCNKISSAFTVRLYSFKILLVTFFLSGLTLACGTATVSTSSQVSYNRGTDTIMGTVGLLPIIQAANGSLSSSSTVPKVAEAPYSPPRMLDGSQSLQTEGSMEGFRSIADDVLLQNLQALRKNTIVVPPRQIQSLINSSRMTGSYTEFLEQYRNLAANPAFLKSLKSQLKCSTLLVPQLVLLTSVNESSWSFIWNFGKRRCTYTVVILAHLWSMDSGEVIWSGRGTASTTVGIYDDLASFEELATKAVQEMIKSLP